MSRRSRFICVLGVLVSSAPGLAQSADDAFEAYNAKQYARCAELFEEAARVSSGLDAANAFYNAGCCNALGGELDAAFAMLSLALDAGYANYDNLSRDSDLDDLRDDPRMEALLERIAPPPIVITDNLKHDADAAEFVYVDAENFVRAMTLIAAGSEVVTTLQAEYFDRASAGLRQMVVKYPFDATDLAGAIDRYPEKYARIASNLAQLRSREPEFRAAYRRFQAIAPDTVFPPTYFLVDRHRGIGSGSPDGQLITIETRTEESIARIETLLVHELVHFQQLVATGPDAFYAVFGPKKTLLALTIREGTAEFFADRVTGRMTQDDTVDYCLTNEADIWRRFQPVMHARDTDGWMWSTPDDPAIPRDVAYVFGSRIVSVYYDRVDDKRQAVSEILAVTDYAAFLEKSGYGDRFEN